MIIEQPKKKKKKKKKNDKTEIEDRISSFVIELAHVFFRFFFSFFLFFLLYIIKRNVRVRRAISAIFFTWVFTSFDRSLRTVHVIDETTMLNREKASNFSTNTPLDFALETEKKKNEKKRKG